MPPRAAVADEAPAVADLTDYDLKHFSTYLRLLDADAEGVDWAEAARTVLRLDRFAEPDRPRWRLGDSLGARTVALWNAVIESWHKGAALKWIAGRRLRSS